MIRALLIIAILLGIGNVAYVLGNPVLRNRMLQGRMVELSKNRGMQSVRSVRADVISYAIDHDIPLESEDVVVRRKFEETHIAARYSVTVRVWFYERIYDFYPASHPEARLEPTRAQRARALGR